MDDIAKYNQARWRALAQVDALFTRPLDHPDAVAARERIDPDQRYGDLHGKSVLCLAGGGGQQSAAFGLLGANVTVVDLSAEQLERDQQMAQHYGLKITTVQADMRDLLLLDASAFDIVFHPYSLNFVPDCTAVFGQVRRFIQTGGLYDLMCANPFAAGVRDWNGEGYAVKLAYQQGQRIEYTDEEWVYDRERGIDVPSPVEYRQTLSTLVNRLTANGFIIRELHEVGGYEAGIDAEPGSWDHFSAVLPPWLVIHAVYHPAVFIFNDEAVPAAV